MSDTLAAWLGEAADDASLATRIRETLAGLDGPAGALAERPDASESLTQLLDDLLARVAGGTSTFTGSADGVSTALPGDADRVESLQALLNDLLERLTAAADGLNVPVELSSAMDSGSAQSDRADAVSDLQALLSTLSVLAAGSPATTDERLIRLNEGLSPADGRSDSSALLRDSMPLPARIFGSADPSLSPTTNGSGMDAGSLQRWAELLRTAESPAQRAAGAETRAVVDSAAGVNPLADAARSGVPAPTAAGTSMPPAHYQAATQQTFDRVAWMVREGLRSARLQLDPPELGRVDIRLEMDGLDTRIQLSAGQAGVREALEAMLPRLREALGQQGLNLADASVADQQNRSQSEAQGPADTVDVLAENAEDSAATPSDGVGDRLAGDALLSAYA
ncbi:MAG: flagellar hook-length control protein FliK [Wenzhouxiangellaceae bacterium]|nr:flagellar hook-length control protein FliK [Wenzhouxiangellaceae bacterium]